MKPLRWLALAAVTLATFVGHANACPFCVAEMQTLSEELADSDAAVIARLVKPAALAEPTDPGTGPQEGASYGTVDPETGEAAFAVEKPLKGEDLLRGVHEIKAIYFGVTDFEKRFLVRALGQPLEWQIPLELSPLAVEYVQKLQSLPVAGADRLAFFQDYLEHDDRQLAQDAYDEFARAPYADLKDLKDRMDRQRVLELIDRPHLSPSRRRLFFVMLGVCGGDEDLPMLESLLQSDATILAPAAEFVTAATVAGGGPLASALLPEVVRSAERQRKLGLDSMIACYLTLRGEEGLDLIDRRFLDNPSADQTHIYSTLMALRFLAEEPDLVSRDRLLASARLLLNNESFADQVITDLARWEDWSVIPRLGRMFRAAGDEASDVSKYVREPIVTYLDVAAEQGGEVGQRANDLIAELEPLDTETFRRARSLAAFGFLGSARPPKKDASEAAADEVAEQGSDDEPLPHPADFEQGVTAEPVDEAVDSESTIAAEEAAPQGAPTSSLPPIPKAADPLTPPSRIKLVGAPLLAAVGCFGLFWFILRGGA